MFGGAKFVIHCKDHGQKFKNLYIKNKFKASKIFQLLWVRGGGGEGSKAI